MRSIIFGASGQDGNYLSALLLKNGHSVNMVSRNPNNTSLYIKGDVSDYEFVKSIIHKLKPDFVFHLAANSSTCHDYLFENHLAISSGTLNILDSAYKYSPSTKIFLTGSGLQFINCGKPISEADSFNPSSPYSVSRIQSVYAGRYFRSLGLSIYVGYLFNHDSPLRSVRHINQRIVQSVKKIVGGGSDLLEISNPRIQKEFCFAGDIVEAIWTLVNSETVYEAVIGSGKAYSIEDWLQICFAYYNLDWREYVVPGPNLKKEYDILVSNPSTIFSLGWRPKVEIQELAKIMIEASIL